MSEIAASRSDLRAAARATRPAWRQPLAVTGAVIAAAWLIIAVFAPLVAPYDPLAQDFTAFQPPSGAHLFGTDELGRDVLSRVIYGSRLSIPLALLLVTVAATIGGLSGAAAGYFRGITDGVVMRVSDLVFAFPAIILAMVVTAVLGRGVRNAVLAIVIVSWPSYARVVRGLVLSIGDSEYVQSSRLLGVSSRSALRPRGSAERRRPRARARDPRSRDRDPPPLRPLVSRARRAAASPRVGRDGRDGHPVLPVLVDGHVSGACDLHCSDGLQLPR